MTRYWDGVLRWCTSHITTGVLEGITSLVQAAQARARGYRTTRNLIAMIYMIAGKPKFTLPKKTFCKLSTIGVVSLGLVRNKRPIGQHPHTYVIRHCFQWLPV